MTKPFRFSPINRRAFSAQIAALVGTLQATSSQAQAAFPTRPVKIIVPYAAGGGPDVLTRKIAPRLSDILGQQVVVENVVGAGGILAAQVAARATPDGYTLMLGATTHVTQKAMQPSVRFDPVKDFVHIMRNNVTPQMLVVASNSPFKTPQDLVDAMRKAPGKFNFGSGGVGSAAHLAGAALLHAMQLQAVHVPYKGSVEIIPSLLAGDTQFSFPVASTAMGPVQQGQVRALATTGSSRLPQLPQLPTLREALGKDELVIETWGGYWAPAGTPAPVVDTLHRALRKLYDDPSVRAEQEATGAMTSISNSPAEFTRDIVADTARYERLVKAIGLGTN
jgi:tripartite-type tricarboxylate transporter receptor subunit TctC